LRFLRRDRTDVCSPPDPADSIALAVLPAVAARTAVARRGAFSNIRVDVAPLRENSLEPTAGWVAQTLPAAISEALAATGRSGTSVAVRIDYVILGPNTSGVGPTGISPDQMVGVVTIGGVERPLRATTSYYAMGPDNTMIEQSNYYRVSQLSQAFAYWVAREL
jgi:hypothetical protein